MCKDNPNYITKRIAVKADCVFKSPALIGSGFENNTDSDILRYSSGTPFLPGSTIAGVLCALCPDTKDLFGTEDNASPLWVLDSKLPDNVIELDGVAIDPENKVALNKKKYDFEAVDADSEFTLRLLLTIRKDDSGKGFEELLAKLLGALESGDAAFGAKTNRGFGRVEYICAFQQVFVLAGKSKSELADEFENWLNFKWETGDAWKPASISDYSSGFSRLKAEMKLDGSIMIRDTRNIYVDTEGKVPDYKHISISGDKPAILGTSWAGAFRSGLHRLLKQKYPDRTEAYLNEVFGYIPDDSEADESAAIVSKIIFGASFLEVSDNKTEGYRNVVRVKIDRFTGGAAGGALFTERPWYGGKTTLEISFPKGREDIKELLLLGLDGIDKGIMQVGGESAIGRGFFKVTTNVTVDGKEESIDKSKQNLVNAIERAGDTE